MGISSISVCETYGAQTTDPVSTRKNMSLDAEDARSRFAYDVLEPFDTEGDWKEFFHSILVSNNLSEFDAQCILEESVLAGAESWEASIDCARSLQREFDDPQNLDGNDVSTFLWHMWGEEEESEKPEEPWQETDRLIEHARALAEDAPGLELLPHQTASGSSSLPLLVPSNSKRSNRAQKRKRASLSHYWDLTASSAQIADDQPTISPMRNPAIEIADAHGNSASYNNPKRRQIEDTDILNTDAQLNCCNSRAAALAVRDLSRNANGHSKAQSPYFADASLTKAKSPTKRPPRGTIPCVPFPPLDSPDFGLIQEKMASSPFWLLAAVTFLIRTKGKDAVPVLYKVKERFPSPAHVADQANAEDIMDMIRHLGLVVHRLNLLQKYARLFLKDAPRRGKVYRVRNYDQRDASPSPRNPNSDGISSGVEDGMASPCEKPDETEAWEIGHMTQGKYAIDSWRIFCRDVLLGRASGWNGEGREPEFQPEWMRVRPDDKELRACLRWMWMREGWEWDPRTGERTVLREELRQAVNDGRVEYDDTGDLRITTASRPSPD